jgi:hypothetical protein
MAEWELTATHQSESLWKYNDYADHLRDSGTKFASASER